LSTLGFTIFLHTIGYFGIYLCANRHIFFERINY